MPLLRGRGLRIMTRDTRYVSRRAFQPPVGTSCNQWSMGLMATPKVEIYTKWGCPYCVSAKALLARKGVAFEE